MKKRERLSWTWLKSPLVRTIEIVLLVLIIFAVTIWAVVTYEEVIRKVNWRLVSVASIFVIGVLGMAYYVNRSDNNYMVIDLLTHENGRADFERHVVLVLLALTVWVVVQNVIDKKDVTNLLLGALGIFILKRVADRATDAYKTKPPAPTIVPPGGATQINAPEAREIHIPEGDGPAVKSARKITTRKK